MNQRVRVNKVSQPADLPDRGDLQALARSLARFAPHDGSFSVADNAIQIASSTRTQGEKTYTLSQPSICIVAQGAKRVTLADDSFEYNASKMVVYAAEMPIRVEITEASKANPYYCLVIPISPERLNNLVLKIFPDGVPRTEQTRSVYVGDVSAQIVEAATRMMRIIEQQDDTDLLVPHMIDEILIRLLRSSVGPAVAQLGISDSYIERISKAINQIKQHYTASLKVEELARASSMSPSSFHAHFKAVTGVTPLKFQKILRLQKARELLHSGMMDVTTVAFTVGYASASQFSREYTREFGVSPSRETAGSVTA
ncbi:AraC family transcriptional regulator [Alteromonas sp. CYL-A6]|uniref:AraC family transcriptional regulator n=1 Tax=Alteromonas nitratireducens TaxID=3390813 RepID=UPI0034C43FA4